MKETCIPSIHSTASCSFRYTGWNNKDSIKSRLQLLYWSENTSTTLQQTL